MANAKQIVLTLETFAEDITKEMMINIRRRLSSNPPIGTPRDTTFASSNWLLSVRRPSDRIVGNKDRISSSAGERSERKLKGWTLGSGSVHCTNNVPYIIRLNEGYSKQTAAGFVEREFNEVTSRLNSRKSP